MNKYPEIRESDFIRLIDLLEDNKNFPYYAAERRIDLFVTYYIEKILTYHFGEEVIFVAPEFPIRHEKTNQADKADVLCMFSLTKRPIIVEIKTDSESFKERQLYKYIKSLSNWHSIVEGISNIAKNKNTKTDYRLKYFFLMQRIVERGLAKYSCDNESELIRGIEQLIGAESKYEKGNRSRKIIELAGNLKGIWSEGAIILYMAPESVVKQINTDKNEFAGIHVLSFNDIVVSTNPELEPYNRFIKFLQTIA